MSESSIGIHLSRRSFLALGGAFCLSGGWLLQAPGAAAAAMADAPKRGFWDAWCDRLLAEMQARRTVLAATRDKDAPLLRTSPLDPGRRINGEARPHYGTDYSSRDANGNQHPYLCLYAPFDAVVTACGNVHDARGEYVVLRSVQQDASFGMVVTRFHMSSQFAPAAGRRADGSVEYHAGVHVARGQAIGLVGNTGWDKNGRVVSTGIHDDVRGYRDEAALHAKRPFDYHPVNALAWELSAPQDYKVLQGRYAHNVDRTFAMRFFASLPQTRAVIGTALAGAPEQVQRWYQEHAAKTPGCLPIPGAGR